MPFSLSPRPPPRANLLSLSDLLNKIRAQKRIPFETLVLDFSQNIWDTFTLDEQNRFIQDSISLCDALEQTTIFHTPSVICLFRRHRQSSNPNRPRWTAEDLCLPTPFEDSVWKLFLRRCYRSTKNLSLANYPGNLPNTLSVVENYYTTLESFTFWAISPTEYTFEHVDLQIELLGLTDEDFNSLIHILLLNTSSLITATVEGLNYLGKTTQKEDAKVDNYCEKVIRALANCPNLKACYRAKICFVTYKVYNANSGKLYNRCLSWSIPCTVLQMLGMGARLCRARLRHSPSTQNVLNVPVDAWLQMIAGLSKHLTCVYFLLRSRLHDFQHVKECLLRVQQQQNRSRKRKWLPNVKNYVEPRDNVISGGATRRGMNYLRYSVVGTGLTLYLDNAMRPAPGYQHLRQCINHLKNHLSFETLTIDSTPDQQWDYIRRPFLNVAPDPVFQEFKNLIATVSFSALTVFDFTFDAECPHYDPQDNRMASLVALLPKTLKVFVLREVTAHVENTLFTAANRLQRLTTLQLYGPQKKRRPLRLVPSRTHGVSPGFIPSLVALLNNNPQLQTFKMEFIPFRHASARNLQGYPFTMPIDLRLLDPLCLAVKNRHKITECKVHIVFKSIEATNGRWAEANLRSNVTKFGQRLSRIAHLCYNDIIHIPRQLQNSDGRQFHPSVRRRLHDIQTNNINATYGDWVHSLVLARDHEDILFWILQRSYNQLSTACQLKREVN